MKDQIGWRARLRRAGFSPNALLVAALATCALLACGLSPSCVGAECKDAAPAAAADSGSGLPKLGTWRMPLDGKTLVVTSPYGYRIHPKTGTCKLHEGTDLRADDHTAVYAVNSGIVRTVTRDSASGKWIEIEHNSGRRGRTFATKYLHLEKQLVDVGDVVKPHQQIAWSGHTGGVPPHLHFIVERNGKKIDARGYLDAWAKKLGVKVKDKQRFSHCR